MQQIIWKLSRQPLKNYRNATLALLKKPRTDYNIQKFLKKYYNFFFGIMKKIKTKQKTGNCFAQHYHEKNKQTADFIVCKQIICAFTTTIFVKLFSRKNDEEKKACKIWKFLMNIISPIKKDCWMINEKLWIAVIYLFFSLFLLHLLLLLLYKMLFFFFFQTLKGGVIWKKSKYCNAKYLLWTTNKKNVNKKISLK